jgi:hypothetical protein
MNGGKIFPDWRADAHLLGGHSESCPRELHDEVEDDGAGGCARGEVRAEHVEEALVLCHLLPGPGSRVRWVRRGGVVKQEMLGKEVNRETIWPP